MHLGASMRFGPAVSGFLRAWLPFCQRLHSHDSAPDTRLLHILYDGSGWESISAAIQRQRWFRGPVPSTPQNPVNVAVGWHQHLFTALTLQVHHDVQWAKEQHVQERPYVLVLTFLNRTVAPLRALMQHLFPAAEEAVDVCTIDSARGRTAPIVHLL